MFFVPKLKNYWMFFSCTYMNYFSLPCISNELQPPRPRRVSDQLKWQFSPLKNCSRYNYYTVTRGFIWMICFYDMKSAGTDYLVLYVEVGIMGPLAEFNVEDTWPSRHLFTSLSSYIREYKKNRFIQKNWRTSIFFSKKSKIV